MTGRLRRLAMEVTFDAVVIEHGIMGDYLNILQPEQHKRAAWVLHDIDYQKFERICRTHSNPLRSARMRLHSAMMRRWMPEFAGRFGMCITMSEADGKLLVSANDRLKVAVSPNGVDTAVCRLLPELEPGRSPALLLVGNMGYGPNIDAAIYFCQEILPLIRQRLERVQLWIVGPNPPPEVRRLGGESVQVTGRVAELAPYYETCAMSVVPLRAGGGTRLKILESLAYGRPVVSTSIGCEGLDVNHGEHLLIADTPGAFVANILAVLRDQSLRNRLVENGRRLVVAKYDWDVIAAHLLAVLEEIRN
jgi:glycosyltransferase involved in cell wall biosynthesis